MEPFSGGGTDSLPSWPAVTVESASPPQSMGVIVVCVGRSRSSIINLPQLNQRLLSPEQISRRRANSREGRGSFDKPVVKGRPG